CAQRRHELGRPSATDDGLPVAVFATASTPTRSTPRYYWARSSQRPQRVVLGSTLRPRRALRGPPQFVAGPENHGPDHHSGVCQNRYRRRTDLHHDDVRRRTTLRWTHRRATGRPLARPPGLMAA